MITEAELMDTKFCCQLIINITNVYVLSFFGSEPKIKPFKCVRAMASTVQLLSHDTYCPITVCHYTVIFKEL